jgi:aminopeptidase N
MIELARQLAKEARPDRTIVFIAFTGEEAGRRGSIHYAQSERRWPSTACMGMVNLDTVGRLGKRKLDVFGTDSAKEWTNIVRGAASASGVAVETAPGNRNESDEKSFHDAGIPAIRLFSGLHADYHHSTDSVDRIDHAGLVKAAAVAKEVVEYLAGREVPLASSLKAPLAAGPTTTAERSAVFGVVADAAYQGQGIRISGVESNSAAEAAGLKPGDVLLRWNDTPLTGMQDLSEALQSAKPGNTVRITVARDDKELAVDAVLRGQ